MDIEIGRHVQLMLTVAIRDVQLQVLVLLDQAASDDIHNDVGFTYVDEHVVFKASRLLLSNEYTVANPKVSDQIVAAFHIVLDLEVSPTVLLCSLFAFIWDHEVVDHVLDSGLLLIEIVLVLLQALFAAEIYDSIAQIVAQIVIVIMGWDVRVAHCVCLGILLLTSAIRLMRHKAECIDQNLLPFD